MHNEFTAVIAPAPEGGYWAYCLEIPAVGEGETVSACKQNLREAIVLMLADRRATERQEAPVPRHTILKMPTARKICRLLGIPEPSGQ